VFGKTAFDKSFFRKKLTAPFFHSFSIVTCIIISKLFIKFALKRGKEGKESSHEDTEAP